MINPARLTRSFALALLISASAALASNDPGDLPAERHEPAAPPQAGNHAGPYLIIEQDTAIVKGVQVNETGRIYILLDPAHKEKEIILKNSSGYKSGYRKWFNGELELVSPANQGKAPNEYTDWVETTGNYVEYYMDGHLILHLGKAAVHKG